MISIRRNLIVFWASAILPVLTACDGGGPIAEDYPCAKDIQYSDNWNEFEFRMENEEPRNCPPDLQAGDTLRGGAEVWDDGAPDGEAALLEIENSERQRVLSIANFFIDNSTGGRLAYIYAEYEIATGNLCKDYHEFDITLLKGGLAWATVTVYYNGEEALVCGGGDDL